MHCLGDDARTLRFCDRMLYKVCIKIMALSDIDKSVLEKGWVYENDYLHRGKNYHSLYGAQWLSGRVLDWRLRGRRFKLH